MTPVDAICRTAGCYLLNLLQEESDPDRQLAAAQASVNVVLELLGVVSREERCSGVPCPLDDEICQLLSTHGVRLTAEDWSVVQSHLKKVGVLTAAINLGTVKETLAQARVRADALVAGLGVPQ